HLAAENKSPNTRTLYRHALGSLGAYLTRQGMPRAVAHITREHIESWLAGLLERRKPATAASYYRGTQQFFKWLAAEGGTRVSPMTNINQPAIPEPPAPVRPDDPPRR